MRHSLEACFHYCKFLAWDIGKKYPLFSGPINYLGRLATRNFRENYRNTLKSQYSGIIPENRYLKNEGVSTQFYVITTSENTPDPDDQIGVGLLFNHLRIPYRQQSSADFLDDKYKMVEADSVICLLDCSADEIVTCRRLVKKRGNIKILSFSRGNNRGLKETKEIYHLDFLPRDLLPYAESLRSDLTARFVRVLKEISDFPIVTGMLPPQVGFRIDDVIHVNLERYLENLVEFGWRPNLGVFLDGFAQQPGSIHGLVKKMTDNGSIELSPHSFSADKFIFYNYPKGRPYGRNDAKKIWDQVLSLFNGLNLELSQVVNPHFHAFSTSFFPLMEERNIRFVFSELFPDTHSLVPSDRYLPSGDPEKTTGQIADDSFIQIFGGDSAQNCNSDESLYDFLMNLSDIASDQLMDVIAEKIVRRVNLSLESGFPAFVTTHEYLIEKYSSHFLDVFWTKIDSRFSDSL